MKVTSENGCRDDIILIGCIVFVSIAVIVGIVSLTIHLVHSYSYSTQEISRSEPYQKEYLIRREYQPAYTEIRTYYHTDSDGRRSKRTKRIYHDDKYYFVDKYRHEVSYRMFNSDVDVRVYTYVKIEYQKIPSYPDKYKGDLNNFFREKEIGDEYRRKND